MIKILRILLIFSIFSVISGPLLAIPAISPGVNVYLSDIVMGTIGLIGLIWLISARKIKEAIKKSPIAKYFLFFVCVSLVSLIFSPLGLSYGEKITSLLYLVRVVIYFSLFPTAIYLVKSKALTKEKIVDFLIVSGLVLAVFGWLQYFLYPDLRNLYYLGWDPHYKRIFGTLLDPNYLGLFLVMTFILHLRKKSSSINWFLRGFLLLTLLFTYSRGSYLALIAALFGYAWMKRKYAVFIITVAVFLVLIPFLPRPAGESARLERMFSVTERLNNWNDGIRMFLHYPVLGVGFNSIRFAKTELGIVQDNMAESHSGAGFDNSFIFVAATTGVIGLLAFLALLGSVYTSTDVTGKVIFLAVVSHSMFVNSLFLPWVMIWWWIVAAVTE